MALTPATLTLEPSLHQIFSQTGITSPVWTLEGGGTLNQSGLYTAPSIAASALIRVHSSFWSSVDSAFTKNVDDTLTVIAANYWGAAVSVGSLNAVGDAVEYICPTNTVYALTVATSSNSAYFGIYSNASLENGESYGSTSYSFAVGDIIRFEKITGNKFVLKKNGTVLFTSVRSYTAPMFLRVHDGGQIGANIKLPKFYGSGIANYTEFQATITITPPLLTTKIGLELYCQSDTLGLANDASVMTFTDLSGNARHLNAKTSNYPQFKTTGNYIQFNGTDSSPLSTTNIPIKIVCGFMVARYDEATFPNNTDGYKGLLSGLIDSDVLVGNANTNKFFDIGYDFYEFRSNDRIYPDSDAPAPMQTWKLVFFRFLQSITIDGVQIGQQRNLPTRKWKGGVKFLALFSIDMHESEIRKNADTIANYYNLTLADVYAYQPDVDGNTEINMQSVNFYDPPEGDRISEVLDDPKQVINLKFSGADQSEVDYFRTFYNAHYALALPFVYRDYRFSPPRDVEGYFDAPYDLEGAYSDWNYSFRFRQKS